MWQNVKYYVIAYVVVLMGALVSTGMQVLESLFPELHPLNKLFANLSGITFGSVIMVVGFIRDKRLTDAQAETRKERERADTAESAIAQAQQQAKQAQTQAELERQRAQKAEAELARVRAEYEAEMLARIRRLEEFTGTSGSQPDIQ